MVGVISHDALPSIKPSESYTVPLSFTFPAGAEADNRNIKLTTGTMINQPFLPASCILRTPQDMEGMVKTSAVRLDNPLIPDKPSIKPNTTATI
ncbi:MAG: hypothetical protein NTY85_05050 [Actinobacteria bacterium]|nr:hypothetical protein [Actinomycetota bacterium]